jgi:probable phosphoglycerate mutase
MSRTNDEPLHEEGLKEVQQVVSQSPHLEYDIVFSSPLKRASETAREFAQARKLEVTHHEGLLEREFGILSNKTWDEVSEITNGALDYEIWQREMEFDLSPYGGETKESVRERLLNFVNHLKTDHSERRPLVVTHGGVLRTLYALFPKHTPTSFKNVSIHEFEV